MGRNSAYQCLVLVFSRKRRQTSGRKVDGWIVVVVIAFAVAITAAVLLCYNPYYCDVANLVEAQLLKASLVIPQPLHSPLVVG